jgi:hypothetical protein
MCELNGTTPSFCIIGFEENFKPWTQSYDFRIFNNTCSLERFLKTEEKKLFSRCTSGGVNIYNAGVVTRDRKIGS